MPTMQDAHIDRALTNMSVAYLQDASTFIADKVFPTVPVKRQSDIYYQYNKGDFMRDEAQVRGAATESAGGDYGVEAQDPYYCRKHAFHKDVTEEERANYDEPLDADQDANEFITQKMLIRREMEWSSKYFKPGIWGTQIEGASAAAAAVPGTSNQKVVYFDSPTSDPIKVFTTAGVNMAETTSYKPNTLVLSPYVFNALKNHEDILDRIKYTQKGIVTTDLLATLFEVEKVVVAWAVVNSAKKGAAENVSFIMGKHALLCYANPRPALRKPSAGYIFAWTGLKGAGAYGNRTIRLPLDLLGLGTERIEGEIAFDAKLICADMGIFLKDIVQ
jgi:hypothetical protein